MRRLESETLSPWWFILLLLAYFGMAVWMIVRLPALATPNELLNFEYIQVMRQIRGLPNRGLVDSEVRYTEWHQPPLYFAFAALTGLPVAVPPADTNPPPPINWPENPAYLSTHQGNLNPVVHIGPANTPLLYTSRLAATLLGFLGLAALYRAGRAVHGPAVALLMASLLAFQPNYVHLSGSVNNDLPLTAVSAIVLAYAVLLIHYESAPRRYFWLGLLAAAAILTKANGVFVLAYLGAAWLADLLRHRDWRRTLKSVAFALAGLLPLWAAWLELNTLRMRDTLGLSGSLPVGRVLALSPADFALLGPWLDDLWRSLWLDWSAGDVGYGPTWFYVLWAVLLGLGLLGWLRIRDGRRWPVTLAVVMGALAITYLFFAVKALTVKEAGYLVPEGRWWLPVMPGLAWLAAVGYSGWWPAQTRTRALLLWAAVPAASTLLLLVWHLPALYPARQALPLTAVAGQEPALVYGDSLALYAPAAPPLQEGLASEIRFSWQALADIERDYTVAAQLLVPSAGGWQKLDEQYSYPTYGSNPTGGWRSGEVYADAVTLRPRGPLAGPLLAQVALHVQDNGRNLPVRHDGEAVDPPLLLATEVRPSRPVPVEHPLAEPVEFGSLFALRGATAVPVGEDLQVTLWWEARQQPPANFTIFAHVLGAQGELLGQSDSPPLAGASPTSIWRPGDVIRDVHLVPGGAAGVQVLVGAYDPGTGQRLAAQQAGLPLPDQAFPLRLAP